MNSSSISTSSDRLNVLVPEPPADDEREDEEDKSEEDFVLFSTSLILDTSSWRGSTVRSSTSSVLAFRFPFSSIFSSCSYLDLPPVLFVVRIHVILLSFFVTGFRTLSRLSVTLWGVKLLSDSRLTALLAFPWDSSMELVLVSTGLVPTSMGAEFVLDCLSNITAAFVGGWRPIALATRKLCWDSGLSVSIEVMSDVASELRWSCTLLRGSLVLDGTGLPRITEILNAFLVRYECCFANQTNGESQANACRQSLTAQPWSTKCVLSLQFHAFTSTQTYLDREHSSPIELTLNERTRKCVEAAKGFDVSVITFI